MNSLSFSLSLSLSLQEPPNRGVGGTRALAHSIIRYNKMMLYMTGKMMLIFLFHLQFGLPIFQLYMAFAMQLVDQHDS